MVLRAIRDVFVAFESAAEVVVHWWRSGAGEEEEG